MKFLIDNALSPEVADLLQAAGHDAAHVRTWNLHEAEDSVVVQAALADERVLVSADTDFGTLLALGRQNLPFGHPLSARIATSARRAGRTAPGKLARPGQRPPARRYRRVSTKQDPRPEAHARQVSRHERAGGAVRRSALPQGPRPRRENAHRPGVSRNCVRHAILTWQDLRTRERESLIGEREAGRGARLSRIYRRWDYFFPWSCGTTTATAVGSESLPAASRQTTATV